MNNDDLTLSPLQERIKNIFHESIQIQIATEKKLSDVILQASKNIVECLLMGHKIIVCGQGRSQANAQLLVTYLVHRFHLERPSLPAVLLDLNGTLGASIIHDNQPHQLFTRQFESIVQTGDRLLIFAPHGEDEAILNLAQIANNREIAIIAFTSRENNHLQGILTQQDINISVPIAKEMRVIENHLLIINILCDLIEHQLFSH